MISGGEESGSPLSQQVDSKSTTMKKSKICSLSAPPSRPRFFANRVTIAPYLRAKAIVFRDIFVGRGLGEASSRVQESRLGGQRGRLCVRCEGGRTPRRRRK